MHHRQQLIDENQNMYIIYILPGKAALHFFEETVHYSPPLQVSNKVIRLTNYGVNLY